MAIQIQFKRGTASQWTSSNPVLALAEMGIETDTRKFKIGDGSTAWNSLSYGGIQGYTGSSGGLGYTGSKGDTGLGFAIAKSYASVAALTADTSPTGIVAGQFAIIETGNVNDADNSKLYLWSGTAYTYVTDLSGAAGITGPQGATGAAGASGALGYTGSAGDNGTSGSNGATGPIGYTGSAGAAGTNGYTGSAGTNGTAGATGPAGYTGSAGAVGTVGANTQVLFNDAGNISANANFTYAKTTGTLTVGKMLPAVGNTIELWAWGSNTSQDLIMGDTVYRTTPTQATLDTREWKSLVSSYNGMFGIKSDNTLWAWGSISYTYNLNISMSSPVQIGTDSWKAIASGSEHNLGVKLDGTLWAWGIGYDGKLGLGDTSHRTSPVQVGALTTWSTVATQYNAGSFAIKTDGTIWAWGRGGNYGFNGVLGLGDTISRSSPTQIGTGTNWASVVADNSGSAQVHAIKTDGTLWSWGKQGYAIGFSNAANVSNPAQVGSATWSKVSAGYYGSAAIKTDGTLWTWGNGDQGMLGLGGTFPTSTPAQVGALTDWASVSVGYYRMVATKTDGSMWAWGYNIEGQIGDGTTTNRSSPVQIGSGTYWLSAVALPINTGTRTYGGAAYFGNLGTTGAKFKNIYAGTFTGAHSGSGAGLTGVVATTVTGSTQSNITALGTLTALTVAADVIPTTTALNHAMWGWGKTDYGLGQPAADTVARSSPIQIGSSTSWVSLGIGWYGGTAVRNDGTLWSWGNAIKGRTTGNTEVGQIGTATNWRLADIGTQTAGAVKTDGTLWTWGWGGYLGLNNTSNYPDNPQQVGTDTNWIYYRAGGSSALGIKGSTYGGGGGLYTWGYNPYGNLGDNSTISRSSPVQVGTATDWKKAVMSIGDFFAVAIKTNGTMWSWGYNGAGTLGIGSTGTPRSSPVQIGALTTWVDVSVGNTHALAVKSDGTLWSWGDGSNGMLGLNNAASYATTPTQIGALTTWAGVAAGVDHSLAIKTDGTVWAWGRNVYGQLGDGTTITRSSPVQVGTTSNWSSIDAGYYISFALDKQNSSLGTSSSKFVNMYASGTVSAGTFSGSGAGLTSLPVSEFINKTIDNQVAANVSSTGGSVLTLPSTAGYKYIVHSMYLTNIDPTFSANISISGNIAFSGGANVSIANKIPVPARGALELLRKPQVLNPGDVINMQALNAGTGAAGVLQTVIAYETKATAETYFGTGVIAGATAGNVYVSTGTSSVINSIRLVNSSDVGNISVTVSWTDGSDVVQAYLTNGFIVPKNASVEICESPKRIPSGHRIKAVASTANAITVLVSGRTQ